MRLEGNFYHILESEIGKGHFSAKAQLEESHPVYQGHFPGKPVVPGVCTLTIIREILGNLLGREVHFSSIKECKFVSLLIPGPDTVISLDFSLDAAELKGTVKEGERTVIKLKAAIND